MCGIAGYVGGSGIPRERMLAALATLTHRGPDAQGLWTAHEVGLGHRRLAVIDLSDAGVQPMRLGHLTIVFNGEIYNYIELRHELRELGHTFRTGTDTEVLLAAYAQWGRDCLPRLNGMWAFALWDESERQLICARDRIGVKPLVYARRGDTLVFASEAKAILAMLDAPVAVNTAEVAAWLASGYSHSDDTWFDGIRKLPPGHWLAATPGPDGLRVDIRRWWHIPEETSAHATPQELRALLADAVCLRLRSDVPLGFHLSGGTDSSGVVALAACAGHAPHTFSGHFPDAPELDERPHVQAMRERLGLAHRETLITPEAWRRSLGELIRVMDHPEAGPGAVNQYLLNALMRENGVVVSLGGQGGDELFGGYWHHVPSHLRSLATRGMRGRLVRELAGLATSGTFLREALGAALRRLRGQHASHGLLAHDVAPATNSAHGWTRPEMGMAKRLRDDVLHYLPALLHVEDRTSMAWSIESRLPLLDYRLVEYVLARDSLDHIRGPRLKVVLRETLAPLLPPTITARCDKRGFNAPLGAWFAGPLADWTRRTLLGPDAIATGTLLDASVVAHALDTHAPPRRDNADAIWKALAIEAWLTAYRHRLLL
ncbi:asparagine synthase (glutamine-hydrolysing) [Desulfobaculum xiamenense]|uniref:asparagine synthase (glutamine-hydrolyzing) n=1 Tax=Desulfobaculum xiamenense TaxID=995050 RepID=A0A846QVT1_9BACT|nr:asparagine synthase (glutamine-hydrolyzing) [Desulfobaculum xiamenense]NJB69224.1 asparagine synthase (glutamine-hydrolysing) [Desulfobaculum xiamenense]